MAASSLSYENQISSTRLAWSTSCTSRNSSWRGRSLPRYLQLRRPWQARSRGKNRRQLCGKPFQISRPHFRRYGAQHDDNISLLFGSGDGWAVIIKDRLSRRDVATDSVFPGGSGFMLLQLCTGLSHGFSGYCGSKDQSLKCQLVFG